MNNSLSYKELVVDIKSTLFLAIREELNIDSNPEKIRSWLYSVLRWRTLDKIKKDCELDYDAEKKRYINTHKVSLDNNLGEAETSLNEEVLKSIPKVKGDRAHLQSGNYINLEYIIRKSKISPFDKTILLFTYVYGNSVKEVCEIIGKGEFPFREKYLPNAINNFLNSLEQTGLFDKETLYEVLNKNLS